MSQHTRHKTTTRKQHDRQVLKLNITTHTILQHSNHSQHEFNEHRSTIQTHNVFNQANIIQTQNHAQTSEFTLISLISHLFFLHSINTPSNTLTSLHSTSILSIFNKYTFKYIHFILTTTLLSQQLWVENNTPSFSVSCCLWYAETCCNKQIMTNE